MDTRQELEWGEFCHIHRHEENKFRTLLQYMARLHPTTEDNIDHLVSVAMKQFGRTGDFADTYRWIYSGADGLVAHFMPGYGAPRAVPNWNAYNAAATRWDAMVYHERKQVLEEMNAPEAVIEEEYYTLFINLPETLRWEIADHFERQPPIPSCSGSDSGYRPDIYTMRREVEGMMESEAARYLQTKYNLTDQQVLEVLEVPEFQPDTPLYTEYYGGDSSRLRQVDIYGQPLPQPSVTYIVETYDPATGAQLSMERFGDENAAQNAYNAHIASLPPGGNRVTWSQFLWPPVGCLAYQLGEHMVVKLYGVVN